MNASARTGSRERVAQVALGVLATAMIVGVLVSPRPWVSLLYGAPMMAGAVVYAWWRHVPLGPNAIRRLSLGLAVGALGLSLLGILVVAEREGWPGAARYLSMVTDVNENVIAGMLVVLWPFGLGVAQALRVHPPRWLIPASLLASILPVAVIAAIPCRGAHVSLALSLVAWLLILKGFPARRLWWALAILIAIMGVASIKYDVWSRLSSSPLGMTARQRVEIWQRAHSVIASFPLTGIGLGNFEAWVLYTQPLLLSKPSVTHAHNLLLQIAVDLGIPGATAYLALMIDVLVDGWGQLRSEARERDAQATHLLQPFLISMCGMVCHGLVDSATWGNKVAFIPWVVMGAISSLSQSRIRPNT